MLSIPSLVFSFYLSVKNNENYMILFEFISLILWFLSKKEYNKKLIRHLSYYSMVKSEIVSEHKAAYLAVITSHVSPCLFETAKIFKEIAETNNKYGGFVLDDMCYRFSKFIYDPESKNRIISLLVYLISLTALLTVAKSDPKHIYGLIEYIDINKISCFFASGVILIIVGYFSIVVPLIFIKTFFINPLLLHVSFADILPRFFISELNRYSYIEKRKPADCHKKAVRLF